MIQELLKKGIRNPNSILPFIRNRSITTVLSLYGRLYRAYSSAADQRKRIYDFIGENNEFVLIVLDACRFDVFKSVINGYLTGHLEPVWSPGSLTPQWGPKIWTSEYDLTYISSNPIIGDFEYTPRNSDFGYTTFCAADHVENFIDAYSFAWDKEVNSVYPSEMTNIALQEAARDKPTRLVVHYLQPHLPFIGEEGFSHYVLDHQDEELSKDYSPKERRRFLESASEISLEKAVEYDVTWDDELKYDLNISNSSGRGYQALLREGIVTKEDIHRGYMDNLKIALDEIRRLARHVDCPVVITSDHGEFLGEFGIYDHPQILHPILRKVPWFKVDRSEIGTEENTFTPVDRQYKSANDDSVRRRLSDLGYL